MCSKSKSRAQSETTFACKQLLCQHPVLRPRRIQDLDGSNQQTEVAAEFMCHACVAVDACAAGTVTKRTVNMLRAYAVDEAGTQGGLLPVLSDVPQLGAVPSCRMYHRSVTLGTTPLALWPCTQLITVPTL